MLLLCTDWVERLGGREKVEQMAINTDDGDLAPYALIINNGHGSLKMYGSLTI